MLANSGSWTIQKKSPRSGNTCERRFHTHTHNLIILRQRRCQCTKSKSSKQKCCHRHVFRASAEWPANVYQITGCTLTVAFLKLHPQMNILNKSSKSGRLLQISCPTGLPFLGNRAVLKNETLLASKGIKGWFIRIYWIWRLTEPFTSLLSDNSLFSFMRLGGLGSTHLWELLAQRLCWEN